MYSAYRENQVLIPPTPFYFLLIGLTIKKVHLQSIMCRKSLKQSQMSRELIKINNYKKSKPINRLEHAHGTFLFLCKTFGDKNHSCVIYEHRSGASLYFQIPEIKYSKNIFLPRKYNILIILHHLIKIFSQYGKIFVSLPNLQKFSETIPPLPNVFPQIGAHKKIHPRPPPRIIGMLQGKI